MFDFSDLARNDIWKTNQSPWVMNSHKIIIEGESLCQGLEEAGMILVTAYVTYR